MLPRSHFLTLRSVCLPPHLPSCTVPNHRFSRLPMVIVQAVVSGKNQSVSSQTFTLPQRLGFLTDLPWRVRIAAIEQTLPTCSPEEAGILAQFLIDLAVPEVIPEGWQRFALNGWWKFLRSWKLGQYERTDRALLALARTWSLLPVETRRTALAVGRGRWHAVMARQATPAKTLDRISYAQLALDSGDTRLAAACATMLTDSDPAVTTSAEHALLGLAIRLRVASGLPDAECFGADREKLEELIGLDHPSQLTGPADLVYGAVAHACMRFEVHRRRGALLAAVVLLDAPALRFASRVGSGEGLSSLATWFHNMGGQEREAMRTVLTRTHLPVARLRALEWLRYPAWEDACLRRMERAAEAHEHDGLLRGIHLFLAPARWRAARVFAPMSRGPDVLHNGALPRPEDYPRLSTESRRGLARLLSMVETDPSLASRILAEAVADEDAAARLTAARALAPENLADYCLDPNPVVARFAALRWGHTTLRKGHVEPDHERARFSTLLRRSPVALVRRIGSEESQLSQEWTGAGQWAFLCARRLLAADPHRLEASLRHALESTDEARCLLAVALVRRLMLVNGFLTELILLLHSGRKRAASAAAMALGASRDGRALEALCKGVAGTDPRVRANSIEALIRSGRMTTVIVEHKDDAHHRVRANVLRAAISADIAGLPVDEAADRLHAMLFDPRPEFRLAGTWVAARTLTGRGRLRLGEQWAELTRRVSELGTVDSDERVRARARHCAARLEGEARAAWRPSVASSVEPTAGTIP
jgi:hypothetical protein